jgi:hypothetical protein
MSATQPKQRVVPLGDALQPTIDRMKAIAAQSSDALLTEGPVHPDHQLLDACSEAMHLFKQAKAARTERHAASLEQADRRVSAEELRLDKALFARWQDLDAQGAAVLRRAKKLRAVTPAGIYAKALLVRSTKTGAREMAMSLAEDLINCPGLRSTLWPATEGV